MDTPKPVAPRRGSRVVAIVTIIVLVALAAWFAYKTFLAPKSLTVEQRKQYIVDQVMADSKPLPPSVKAAVTTQFAKDQAKADKLPDLSAAQKAAIIQNVAAGK